MKETGRRASQTWHALRDAVPYSWKKRDVSPHKHGTRCGMPSPTVERDATSRLTNMARVTRRRPLQNLFMGKLVYATEKLIYSKNSSGIEKSLIDNPLESCRFHTLHVLGGSSSNVLANRQR